MEKITVNVEWHAEAGVWVATSDDIWGLAAQSKSLEKLREKVLPMIADLIELNEVTIAGPAITVHFIAHSTDVLNVRLVA